MKSVHSSSSINTTTLDPVPLVTLKPPPLDRTKSFDDEDLSIKPVVTKIPTPVPENVKLYSIADLQMATDSFSVENLIGEGSIGRVYRAQFDDGKVYAPNPFICYSRINIDVCYGSDVFHPFYINPVNKMIEI